MKYGLVLFFSLFALSVNALDFRDNPVLASLDVWPKVRPQVIEHTESMFRNAEQIETLFANKKQDIKIIVELGSWVGMGSTKYFLDHFPDAIVIAIDTWKGNARHLVTPHLKNILPVLYDIFLKNMWKYQNRLIPMKMTAFEGLQTLYDLGIQPDIIYVDDCHEYEYVVQELELIWSLFPTTYLIGDDWNLNNEFNSNYPVRRAVQFFAQKYVLNIYAEEKFWHVYR